MAEKISIPANAISPYRLFGGMIIPGWLISRTAISLTAKVCYAAISECVHDAEMQDEMNDCESSEFSVCRVRLKDVCKKIGIDEVDLTNAIIELKMAFLIKAIKDDVSQYYTIYLLYHEWQNPQFGANTNYE
jgi:hypothetical protein